MRWSVLVLAALVVGAGTLAHRKWQRAHDEWEAQVEAGLALAAAAEQEALRALRDAESLGAQRDSLERELDEERRMVRDRVEQVRVAVVPEPCAALIAGRDSIIDTLLELDESRVEVRLLGDLMDDRLRVAVGAALDRGQVLSEVLEARPSSRPRWLPRAGAGLFVGLSFAGQPTAGVGITLSWEVF